MERKEEREENDGMESSTYVSMEREEAVEAFPRSVKWEALKVRIVYREIHWVAMLTITVNIIIFEIRPFEAYKLPD